MSYPQVLHRKSIEHINAATGARFPAIECEVRLSAQRGHVVAIDTALLGFNDENESDVFIEAAQSIERKLAA
jgi:hypothetical protein